MSLCVADGAVSSVVLLYVAAPAAVTSDSLFQTRQAATPPLGLGVIQPPPDGIRRRPDQRLCLDIILSVSLHSTVRQKVFTLPVTLTSLCNCGYLESEFRIQNSNFIIFGQQDNLRGLFCFTLILFFVRVF